MSASPFASYFSRIEIRKNDMATDVSLRGDTVESLFWKEFWKDERGQDMVEYSLLLAFVALVGLAAFIGMGQTTSGLWSIVNTRLAAANQSS